MMAITEMIPDDLPEWAIKAMAEGQLFTVTFDRIRKLESMCKAAASEINDHWESHCDDEGYGCSNLMSRLEGRLPPDLYISFDSQDNNKKGE
jgi:hypothetical protein